LENESLHRAAARACIEVVTSVDKSVKSVNILMLNIVLRHIEVTVAVERRQHVQLLLRSEEWPLCVRVKLPRGWLKGWVLRLRCDLGIACIRVTWHSILCISSRSWEQALLLCEAVAHISFGTNMVIVDRELAGWVVGSVWLLLHNMWILCGM